MSTAHWQDSSAITVLLLPDQNVADRLYVKTTEAAFVAASHEHCQLAV